MERSTLSTPNTPNLGPERLAARLFQKKSAASGEQNCFLRIVVLLECVECSAFQRELKLPTTFKKKADLLPDPPVGKINLG